jgi:hypothetical protein
MYTLDLPNKLRFGFEEWYLLWLGLVLVSLIGSMMMPALVHALRWLPVVILAALQVVGRLILEKLFESLIVAALALGGGLWVLDILPIAYK